MNGSSVVGGLGERVIVQNTKQKHYTRGQETHMFSRTNISVCSDLYMFIVK